MMRVPFDILNQDDLQNAFMGVGYSDMQISKEAKPLTLLGSFESIIEFTYATPIGPELRVLNSELQ